MSDVTKEDMNRMYDQLGDTNVKVQKLTVHMAEVCTHLKSRTRPCQDHVLLHQKVSTVTRELGDKIDTHIEGHNVIKRTWQQTAIRSGVHVVEIAFVFLFGYWVSKKG